MNARQRRTLDRLYKRAFGTHEDYWITVRIPMDYDGINLCEKCGEYTTSRLCRSCAEQEMIDNDPNPVGFMSPGWRDENGFFPDGEPVWDSDEPPTDAKDTTEVESQ